MKYEKSCGAVVYYLKDKEPVFLLIKHKNGSHWDFPKGHVEKGESEQETAQREIFEETGLEVDIDKEFRETVKYSPKKEVEKEVVFFIAKAKTSEVKTQPVEIESFDWLKFNDATRKLTFESATNIIKKAYRHINHFQKN